MNTAAAAVAADRRPRRQAEWEASRAERRAKFEELVAPLDSRSRQVLEFRFGIGREVPRTWRKSGHTST